MYTKICDDYKLQLLPGFKKLGGKYFRFYEIPIAQILTEYVVLLYTTLMMRFLKISKKVFPLLWNPCSLNYAQICSFNIHICLTRLVIK